ncbi:MAG TPA: DUF3052 domain-containing protein [Gemmatimonadales bacterium]|jgi:hypothetical protein|nr:DUF3052 domain-containing protein [Gemmatimonadales bacterium]
MAGYSGRPLVGKLGLKPSHRYALPGAPAGFAGALEPIPPGARVVTKGRSQLDFVLLFASDRGTLGTRFPRWAARLSPAGMLWVAWPKKTSGVTTDLDGNVVRNIGLAAGLVDIKVCAVDEVWSGLKFVRRLRDR